MAESHGNSTAAWTGVGIILLATLITCIGVILGSPTLWIPGAVLVVVGVVAWIVLDKAGYGENGHRSKKGTSAVR
ncbi:HGxxPAAW family protein [Gephyromycinifex aptenodytis]|uniref:HGxxPAAW family protein n=1 Tax=Gephyromycinifex aptenodytis TaxID=2716227 RepID=UPI0014457EA4|nr:HGxxPAAW family protein [Gephyromycinifex aptenodytis]